MYNELLILKALLIYVGSSVLYFESELVLINSYLCECYLPDTLRKVDHSNWFYDHTRICHTGIHLVRYKSTIKRMRNWDELIWKFMSCITVSHFIGIFKDCLVCRRTKISPLIYPRWPLAALWSNLAFVIPTSVG